METSPGPRLSHQVEVALSAFEMNGKILLYNNVLLI